MNKYIIGFLTLVILTTSIYILLPEEIRIDVANTKTTYSLWRGTYELAATERVILMDGSKIMRASSRTVDWKNESGIITISRKADYKDNISTYETYVFDSTNENLELIPVSHNTVCMNCVGKILEFEYKDIFYSGETKDITSPFVFGKENNMKLEWQEGAYLSKVYTYKTASPKIWIRYKPTEDIQSFQVRLFDPVVGGINITILQDGLEKERKYELGTTAQILILANNTIPGTGPSAINSSFFNDTFTAANQALSLYNNWVLNAVGWQVLSNQAYSAASDTTAEHNITLINLNTTGFNYSFYLALGATKRGGVAVCNDTHGVIDYCGWDTGGGIGLDGFHFELIGSTNLYRMHEYKNEVEVLVFNYTETNTGLYNNNYTLEFFKLGYSSCFNVYRNKSLLGSGCGIKNLTRFRTIGMTSNGNTYIDNVNITTANRTTYIGNLCVDIDYPNYGTDYACAYANNLSINYTQSDIIYTEINGSAVKKNVSSEKTFNISAYRYPLRYFGFQLNGLLNNSVYPTQARIDMFNDGVVDAIYPNLLNGTNMQMTNFDGYPSKENLTYASAGVYIRVLNFSTNNIITTYSNLTSGKISNFTMRLNGYQQTNDSFSFTELFRNQSNISSLVNTSIWYYYDDFSVGDTLSKWGGDYSVENGYLNIQPDFTAVQTYVSCVTLTGGGSSSGYSQSIDLEDENLVTFRLTLDSVYSESSNSVCSQTCWCAADSEAGIKDVTTDTDTAMQVANYPTDVDNVVTIYNDGNYLNWYGNGVYKGRVAYDSSHSYEIYGTPSYAWSSRYSDFIGDTCLVSCSGNVKIYSVNITGMTSHYNVNMTWNETNSTLVSTMLYNSSLNYTRAKITADIKNEDGGSYYLYLSNNNGTTWEAASNGNYHVFSSNGNLLKAKINISVTDNETPIIIRDYSIDTGIGTASNPKVDVGCDGEYEFNRTGIFNETYSPQYVNVSGIYFLNYIYDNCEGLTCPIPVCISSDSSGIMQYSDVYIAQEINKTVFLLDNLTYYLGGRDKNVTFNITYINGTIEVSSLDSRYYGDKPTNITAHINGISSSALVYWYYSGFELIYPLDVYYWELFASKRNQNNTQPYGQNATRGIWKANSTAMHMEGVDIYVKYNESIDSCVTKMLFTGANFSKENYSQSINVTLNTSAQLLINRMNVTNSTNIWTYTDLNCSGNTKPLIIPYFCFYSICSDCVRTYDWEDTCDVWE